MLHINTSAYSEANLEAPGFIKLNRFCVGLVSTSNTTSIFQVSRVEAQPVVLQFINSVAGDHRTAWFLLRE